MHQTTAKRVGKNSPANNRSNLGANELVCKTKVHLATIKWI